MKRRLPLILAIITAATALALLRPVPPPEIDAVIGEDIGPAEAAAVISKSPDLVIIDVRTPGEFRQGHLAGALNIDYYAEDFAHRLGQLDPDARYLFYCRTGGRSRRTLDLLRDLGFRDVLHLKGGIRAWSRAGMPLSREDLAAPAPQW